VTCGCEVEAVGKSEEIEIPEGAQDVDVTGKTAMPGIIEVHTK